MKNGLQKSWDKKNIKKIKGTFHGEASNWQAQRKRQLGVLLLQKAMQILFFEGEKQLRTNDIDIKQYAEGKGE